MDRNMSHQLTVNVLNVCAVPAWYGMVALTEQERRRLHICDNNPGERDHNIYLYIFNFVLGRVQRRPAPRRGFRGECCQPTE